MRGWLCSLRRSSDTLKIVLHLQSPIPANLKFSTSEKSVAQRTLWADRVARSFTFLWLGWILLAATNQLIRFFPPPGAPLNGDAQWTYLPNARAWLKAPWDFLTHSPDSYHVAPLGYLWAAVWGANAPRIQLANCVLFLACVLLIWRCATRRRPFAHLRHPRQ